MRRSRRCKWTIIGPDKWGCYGALFDQINPIPSSHPLQVKKKLLGSSHTLCVVIEFSSPLSDIELVPVVWQSSWWCREEIYNSRRIYRFLIAWHFRGGKTQGNWQEDEEEEASGMPTLANIFQFVIDRVSSTAGSNFFSLALRLLLLLIGILLKCIV